MWRRMGASSARTLAVAAIALALEHRAGFPMDLGRAAVASGLVPLFYAAVHRLAVRPDGPDLFNLDPAGTPRPRAPLGPPPRPLRLGYGALSLVPLVAFHLFWTAPLGWLVRILGLGAVFAAGTAFVRLTRSALRRKGFDPDPAGAGQP